MIRHDIGQDTYVDYDWTDDDDETVTVSSAACTIDNVAAAGVVSINVAQDDGTTMPVVFHLADDYSITAGNHTYRVTAVATDTSDIIILGAGLLRVVAAA